jgi:hypothetical protein
LSETSKLNLKKIFLSLGKSEEILEQ